MKKKKADERPLVGYQSTFREAFPMVSGLRLEVTAEPLGFGRVETYQYSLENAPGQYCPCPNPLCSGGGLDLGSELERLIHERKESGEWSRRCRGGEKIGKSFRRCYYKFTATVSIEYHAEG